MGTDEAKAPLAMYGYSGFMAMKLLFELGVEGCRSFFSEIVGYMKSIGSGSHLIKEITSGR
ncbi:MAG: hypothetical protein ACFFB3_11210 [Candidatus Hodarchaeota archaeon]